MLKRFILCVLVLALSDSAVQSQTDGIEGSGDDVDEETTIFSSTLPDPSTISLDPQLEEKSLPSLSFDLPTQEQHGGGLQLEERTDDFSDIVENSDNPDSVKPFLHPMLEYIFKSFGLYVKGLKLYLSPINPMPPVP